MADLEEQSKRQAHVEGRLIGLSQLVSVLSEAMESENESPALLKSIVLHISNETESIIGELKGTHGEDHPALVSAQKKAETLTKKVEKSQPEPETLKKHVEAADELMKNLVALREEASEEKE